MFVYLYIKENAYQEKKKLGFIPQMLIKTKQIQFNEILSHMKEMVKFSRLTDELRFTVV